MKTVYRPLVVLSAFLMISFLVWVFTLHGTVGLFRVNGPARLAIIAFACLAMALLGLPLGRLGLKNRRFTARAFYIPILLVAFTGIIISGAGLVYLNVASPSFTGNISPQLILTEGTGARHLPNMAVVFYTPRSVRSTLSWGDTTSRYLATDARTTVQHVYQLADLSPETEYWYRLDNGPTYRFKTPELHGGTLRFAAAGDAHFGASDARHDLTAQMLAQIAKPSNGFSYFFSLGDLVEWGFANNHWQAALDALTPIMSTIPTRLVAGNHETLMTGLKYYRYFAYPEGAAGQSGTPLWNRIDVGNIHFLVLDIEWSAESYTKEQAGWLESQLQDIPANDWKIVVNHGYYYSSGSVEDGWHWYDNPETIRAVTPLFEKYGVNLVLSGHNHHLEILQKSGVTYLIGGSFGGLPDNPRTYVSPYSLWYAPGYFGFFDITVNGNQADIVFRDPDLAEIKHFNATK